MNQIAQVPSQLRPKITEIFHWQSSGEDKHCLLRIYLDESANSAIVIASKLYSQDERCNHISTDYEQLALAVISCFHALLRSRHQITWMAHYGLFSKAYSFENLTTPERFSCIELPWPLPQYLANFDGEWRYLYPTEVNFLKEQLNLEPVADLLERISSDPLH